MKSTLIKFVFLFIATSCVCGMCSKGNDQSDNSNNNNNTNNGLPAENTVYIAYYAIADGLGINQPHYLVATKYKKQWFSVC